MGIAHHPPRPEAWWPFLKTKRARNNIGGEPEDLSRPRVLIRVCFYTCALQRLFAGLAPDSRVAGLLPR